MRKLKLTELGRKTIEEYKSAEKKDIVVVLDNIRSGLNVGAFFRTADAFGLKEIVLTGISPTPPHKEIHKSAIGATLSMDWRHEESTREAILSLKANGYTIVAIEQTTDSIHLKDHTWASTPTAIVFGNEVEGVTADILPLCDVVLDIEQFGTKHSLNVSVCGGVVLWAAQRGLGEFT